MSYPYPERDLNPHGRTGQRILSPDNIPENTVESELSGLHFDAKYDIFAPSFRTLSALRLKTFPSKRRINIIFSPMSV